MKLHQATAEQLRERLAEVEAGVKMTTTIIIRPQQDAWDPREDDNAGTMWCQHSRYNLGDKGADDPYETVEGKELDGQWMTAEEVDTALEFLKPNTIRATREELEAAEWEERRQLRSDVAAILPLYLYDHSGITMSTVSFSCPWDSGQVGWIYMTQDTIEAEFGGDMEKALACLKCEVETYDQYLTGDVYGFEVWEHEEGTDAEDGNCIDSCWGFYGSDPFENGISEHIEPQLHELLRNTDITYWV